jgi:hypothetical protein
MATGGCAVEALFPSESHSILCSIMIIHVGPVGWPNKACCCFVYSLMSVECRWSVDHEHATSKYYLELAALHFRCSVRDMSEKILA